MAGFAARGFAAALVFVACAVVVACDRVEAVAARSRPSRLGRVAGRLPRTLGSALAAFFVFFFADFSAIALELAREWVRKSRFQWLQSTADLLR